MSTALRTPSPSLLSDPKLHASLAAMARRRVPEADVEDVVQSTLTEALASPHRPQDEEALRQWVHGIARHKIADLHRRRGREPLGADDVASEASAEEGPAHDAIDLLRWAEREAPEQSTSKRTLDWMLREADGEKLESIARDAKVPAPRVRQRVARMRKHFRARWAAQLAAVAALIAVVAYAWTLRRAPLAAPPPTRDLFDPIQRQAGEGQKQLLSPPPPAPAPPPGPAPAPAPTPSSLPPPTKSPPKSSPTAAFPSKTPSSKSTPSLDVPFGTK